MDIADLVALPFRYKPWRPRHLGLILDSLREVRGEVFHHAVRGGRNHIAQWLLQVWARVQSLFALICWAARRGPDGEGCVWADCGGARAARA